MNHERQHAFEAARPGECCNTSHSAKRTEILKLRRRKKDDLSEMPGFLSGGFPFKSVVRRACLALRLGKCFTCACLPVLFGGMAQKLF